MDQERRSALNQSELPKSVGFKRSLFARVCRSDRVSGQLTAVSDRDSPLLWQSSIGPLRGSMQSIGHALQPHIVGTLEEDRVVDFGVVRAEKV